MPLGWGSSAAFTTADQTAGRQYTRLRGPLLIGATNDLVTAGAGASISAPHIFNVSTMRANAEWNGGQTYSSVTGSAYGFTPLIISTYAMSSSGGTSSGPAPTFIGANIAAMVYDTISSRLCIYSTVAGEWRSVSLSSS